MKDSNTQPNSSNDETLPPNPAAAEPTSDPVAELQAKLKEQEQKYVYLYADFENYKKRAMKERQDIVKFGWENVASELIGVLDNLDRAIAHAKPNLDQAFVDGVKMVAQQFHSTLEKQGVATIQTENQAFNPDLHEGVGQVPSEKPEGMIAQEHQKGYTLHGRLLRPSRVLISTGKPAN